ncbi:helix-turn-helix domain-containing protein [Oceanobacillus sp. 1P07AA]|uniref:helix-turn-helix domain-containing protein n=1 Tax=Oceanobacillus sp. 1P07AA TaxID=3132293 RepID=UPI0039A64C07
MNNIGDIIKLERLKQQIKQTQLAKGICSTSYLSKIENNTTTASDEVINLLLQKLNIELSDQEKNEDAFIEEIRAISKRARIYREYKFIEEKLNELQYIKNIYRKTTFLELQLLILRLTLFFEDKERSTFYLDYLEQEKDNFTPNQQFLFLQCKAIFHHTYADIHQALTYFKEALVISSDIVLEGWERADHQYMLAIAYNSCDEVINTIEYGKLSLKYFQRAFIINRTIDCYLLIGIAYKKGNNLKEALDSYELALKMTNETRMLEDVELLKGVIYQNLGSLSSHLQPEKVIPYYKKSLSYKQKANNKLITIFSIVIEYAKYEKWDKVSYWIDQGFTLIKNAPEAHPKYTHHLKVYQDLAKYQYITEEVGVAAINYFDGIQDLRHCLKYSGWLANGFKTRGKYKLASIYFQMSQEYLLKRMNIDYIGDL